MSDTKLQNTGSPYADTQYVTRDDSLKGSGTVQDPLGVATVASAQVQITAHTDNFVVITYSAVLISLNGRISYGGIDESTLALGYLKIVLTLTENFADRLKIPLPGIHFPQLPPGPVGETVFLYVPPIPLQTSSDDASMLMPIFGKGINNTDEIVDATYQLLVVRP